MPNQIDDHDAKMVTAWGKILGNASLAQRLYDVCSGRTSVTPEDALEIMEASAKLETRARAAYVRLAKSLRPKIEAARLDLEGHRARTQHLFGITTSDAGSAAAQ